MVPVDISDYRAFLKKAEEAGEGRRVGNAARDLRYLTQAEVAAKDLTGQPAWDLFLRYLRGALEESERQLQELGRALVGPGPIDAGQLYELRVRGARLDERIRTIEAMVGMPTDVINMGEKAKNLLDRLGEKNGRDGTAGGAEEGDRVTQKRRSGPRKRPAAKSSAAA